MKKLTLVLGSLFFFFGIVALHAQGSSEDDTKSSFEGFFNFTYDDSQGKILLEVGKEKLNTEFLYVHSLRTGLGSNDIGLDRGQLGDQAVVKFVKSGNKLLLFQPNLKFRAITYNELEKQSIKEAFATSVLFGFEIKESSEKGYTIDLTPFIMQDAHGVAKRLKDNQQGTYKLDAVRSSIWLERTRSFPENSEFEALLTFVGEPKGGNIRSVAPDANSISVIQHHSFVALPDEKYEPRAFHPSSGSYPLTYMDYSTPIWEPIEKRFIQRHRLEKIDPQAPRSRAKEPIIYYLDPGTPEPVRSALLEGAQWWNQAFEAIGYIDAFQVKMLPENVDPMDVRYNVIQWVHRSTRGWSYGGSVVDPRTGEIIKGHVSLGSLRIRQDFMIAQAMLNAPFATSDLNYKPMLDMALARIRQLSAHEVGHTIGFAHNFAASSNNKASVMDYPHPALKLEGEAVVLTDAYATGIGDWDKVTVAYSYSDIPDNINEDEYLYDILKKARDNNLDFISDRDARDRGGAHPTAHLWDNGANASEELENVLSIRKTAIQNFSEHNIRNDQPYSVLEDVFVPLYFYHRYQTEAAVKLVGGIDYSYAIKNEDREIHKTIPREQQMQALKAVLKTIAAENLMIPSHILKLFPPRAFGYDRSRESFKSDTGVAFDAIGAAMTASDMTISLLLDETRANRLVQQQVLDPSNLGLQTLLDILIDDLFSQSYSDLYLNEIAVGTQYRLLQHILKLAASDKSSSFTKGIANASINYILSNYLSKSRFNKKHTLYTQMLVDIEAFQKNPEKFKLDKPPKLPDGSPIGSFQCGVYD